MSSSYFCEEPLFIHGNNIFEWTVGEKQLRQQKTKSGYDAILDILDSLGYYGVRFHNKEKSNRFEMIIGGLSWCIGYIKPEYNYDISFSEGMSLGKKIALSERIIDCLREMEYPNSIWPQQIQGLDFHAIESIFRWLYDKITEIRNSLPKYECIAAQSEFDDAFVFDVDDCPSSSFWGQFSIWSPADIPCDSNDDIFVNPLKTCDPSTIHSFYNFMSHCDSIAETFQESLIDDSILSEPVQVDHPSEEINHLLTLRQDRIHSIEQLTMEEQQKQQQIEEYTIANEYLQDTYKQTTARIHDVSTLALDPRTSAKLQELKNKMQLFETLTFQYNKNIQFYKDDLTALERQFEIHQMNAEHEEEQYRMIQGIHDKVSSSLKSLLSIYRSINREILINQCYLEKIPSTPELLFFEYEITQLMEQIVEKTLELSQCYDMKNYRVIIETAVQSHLQFIRSLLTALKHPKAVRSNQHGLKDQLNGVEQQLTRLTQQYNCELKKRNRVLKTVRGNEMNVVEKVRSHSKLMQTFRDECENNKELMKRIRELQKNRN